MDEYAINAEMLGATNKIRILLIFAKMKISESP